MRKVAEQIIDLFEQIGHPLLELWRSDRAGDLADPGDPIYGDFAISDYATVTEVNVLFDDEAYKTIFEFELEHDVDILKLKPGYNKSLLQSEGFEQIDLTAPPQTAG